MQAFLEEEKQQPCADGGLFESGKWYPFLFL